MYSANIDAPVTIRNFIRWNEVEDRPFFSQEKGPRTKPELECVLFY